MLEHGNIVKVRESVKDVEIVLPFHMKFAKANLQGNMVQIKSEEDMQMLRDYLDNRPNLKLLEE